MARKVDEEADKKGLIHPHFAEGDGRAWRQLEPPGHLEAVQVPPTWPEFSLSYAHIIACEE
jgi:hypothetical protein